MSLSLKSLVASFCEHRKMFLAAGGKPKAIKYPQEWHRAAVHLRRELKIPIGVLAKELGIGHSALKRWCDDSTDGRAPVPKTRFVPVEVVAPTQRRDAASARAGALRVSLREISVDIDPAADEAFIAHVIAALSKNRGHEVC